MQRKLKRWQNITKKWAIEVFIVMKMTLVLVKILLAMSTGRMTRTMSHTIEMQER